MQVQERIHQGQSAFSASNLNLTVSPPWTNQGFTLEASILERVKLTFWGAAQVVTGSMHHLIINEKAYLLDCGQFQGRRKEAEARNKSFPFSCKDISAVMLSHAHIDHSGNLPLLVKNGFHGPIYASPGTADLCRPMLMDSATLQEKDAAFLNKRTLRRKSLNVPLGNNDQMVEPLYTVENAEATFPLFRPTPMHTPIEIGPGLRNQVPLINLAKREQQLRLMIQSRADAVQHRRDMLAHRRPIRTTAREEDFLR